MNPSTKSKGLVVAVVLFVIGILGWLILSWAQKTVPKDSILPVSSPPAQEPVLIQDSIFAMGTGFDITIAMDKTGSTEAAEEAVRAGFQEVKRIERMSTTYQDDSFLSKVNSAAGKSAVQIPAELIRIVDRTLEFSRKTEGKFDITFGPLGQLWDFKSPHPVPPTPQEIAERLPLVNFNWVTVDHDHSTLKLEKEGMSVGVGGIIPGYTADRVAEILRTRGYPNFMVNAGGEVCFSGTKGGRTWQLGIQHPRKRDALFARIPIQGDEMVSTSGDYERFFEYEGRRYHHLIDPATGYPPEGIVSATVFADSTARADALSTAVFLLGAKKGMQLIESDKSLSGLIITDKFEPLISSGLKNRLELIDSSRDTELSAIAR